MMRTGIDLPFVVVTEPVLFPSGGDGFGYDYVRLFFFLPDRRVAAAIMQSQSQRTRRQGGFLQKGSSFHFAMV